MRTGTLYLFYIIIDAIDTILHPSKLHPIKIDKLIHSKINDVPEIKSISARLRLIFDNFMNATLCLI